MRGLNGWMRLLEGSQSAVLSNLLKELDRITSSDESSAMQLADVILKDASLTSSVIKIGNSVQFNASSIPVTTVSRAILNIGFKHIRSVVMSIKVLEAVLKESPAPLLISRIATTLHGAAQAQALCANLPDWKQEEVFVASLLSHLVELLVLGTDEPDAKQLKEELLPESSDVEKNKAAERILGVSFTRLSKTLMKQWRIEGLVNEVLSKPDEPSEIVQAIQFGDEISRTALFGWESPEFKDVMERVAEFKQEKPNDVRKALIGTADEAAESIAQYGRAVLLGHIPTSKKAAIRYTKSDLKKAEQKLLLPDPSLQLKTLQSLTSQLMTDFNINKVFKTVLGGMHKGVGLERATLAIFDKTHQRLVTKYAEGEGTDKWTETFILKYVKSHTGFLHNLFEQDQPIWVGYEAHRHVSKYVTPEYRGLTGCDEFFIAPLTAKGKKVGVIYADMGVSGRELTQEYFEGFNHFIQQTRLALTVLASK